MDASSSPLIGITLGDYNGIGPEIMLRTLADERVLHCGTPVIYAPLPALTYYQQLLQLEAVKLHPIAAVADARPGRINVRGVQEGNFEVTPGQVTLAAGQAARQSLETATADLVAERLQAVVTAPINKHNMRQAGFAYPGHTEYFAHVAGVPESLMLLCSGALRVGVLTGHLPLRDVAGLVTAERLQRYLHIFLTALRQDFGCAKPRIAVLGLNPHAGENGALGQEEQQIIGPVVEQMRAKGHLVFGPYPADGFFGMFQYRKFDGVLAMYHDQGLIPFKTLAFETGVNYTAGLKLVRTSPDHGTAYDLAGKGMADIGSFREAFFVASDILRQRHELPPLVPKMARPHGPRHQKSARPKPKSAAPRVSDKD